MTGWVYLLVAVACSTLIWPVARWGLAGTSRPEVVGLWTSLAMGAVSAVPYAAGGQWDAPVGVWVAAALLALAYAVGFWLLIMRALKIGPAGPTVTVNNMAMVCGVLYGVLYLRPAGMPGPLVIAGAAGTCAALLLIGIGNGSRVHGSAAPPPRWLPMVVAGGAMSGLSFMTQTYIGETQREHRFTFLMAGAFAAALILLPLALRPETRWSRRELLGGVAVGVMSGAGMLLTLAAFAHLGSAIVLPFSVTTPVLLMLVIGHFAYHERLGRAQLSGCLVGALSVLLLALGSG